MRIAYARVSRDEQNLALQIEALRAAGCVRIFTDQGVSGAATERKGLSAALAAMQPGSTLVVWKLDRLARSLKFLIDLIEDFHARDCAFISLTEGFDTTTNTGKLVFHVVAAIAEFERGLITERTRAGVADARRRGKRLGRPRRLSVRMVREAHRLVTVEHRPISHVARDLNVSHDTLTRSFRRQGLAA